MRRLAALFVIVIATSACQVEITLGTEVAANGSGVFQLAIQADREVVTTRAAEGGLEPITALFEGLAAKGWSIVRTEPDGGVRISGKQTYTDPEDLGRVLDELRSARTSPDAGAIGSVDLSLSVERDEGLLSTRTSVLGAIDTSALDALGPELVAELRRLVTFRIIASLPDSPLVESGEAEIEDNYVVWRPQLGEAFELRASSVRRSTGVFLGLLFGLISLVLLSVVAIGRFRRGRRQEEDQLYEALAPLEVKRPELPESER